MSSDFNKGVRTGWILYGAGTLLTIIVHVIAGWDYAHAPPPSFVVILITLMIVVGFFIWVRFQYQ